MSIEFPIPFVKMSGTGNDFIIIDHRRTLIPEEEQPEFARRVCRRMFSVGADGLILVENSEDADFRWRFYNADGSEAEMCGNGARCVARFANLHNIAGKTMTFSTRAGAISAEVKGDDLVQVELTPPTELRRDVELVLDGNLHTLQCLNTGVPHAVLFCHDTNVPVKEWGRAIRQHDLFHPAGTNVNFVTPREDGSLLVRTYERGVEDETRACGTGAVAAAILACLLEKTRTPVQVETSGGDRLQVDFALGGGVEIERVLLTGPARLIYKGMLDAESLM